MGILPCRFCLLISLLLFSCLSLHFYGGVCTEFEVGGDHGWTVPTPKDGENIYFQWASKNRFKINDTLRFKYKTDSVMVVTEEEYKKCKSIHPLFFSNNGDSVFTLDRPGLFYFISGVSGHCERGQKMIIKVLMEPAAEAPTSDQSADSTSKNSSMKIHGGKAVVLAAIAAPTVMFFFFMSSF